MLAEASGWPVRPEHDRPAAVATAPDFDWHLSVRPTTGGDDAAADALVGAGIG